MSFHNNPKYQIPALIQALKEHGLPHDKPSQLSDAFRIGFVSGMENSKQFSIVKPTLKVK